MIEPYHLNSILRLLVMVGWAFVVLWTPGASRTLFGGKLIKAGLMLTGVAIISFQLNVLSGSVPPRTDYWSSINLAGVAVAAAIFIVVLLPRSPHANKAAATLAPLAIIAACIVGGSLA
uniref:hypothetical protein n=1 Tax=uncultured Sphingomonas sp. TaxID=158754 RepID=UPI0035CBB664